MVANDEILKNKKLKLTKAEQELKEINKRYLELIKTEYSLKNDDKNPSRLSTHNNIETIKLHKQQKEQEIKKLSNEIHELNTTVKIESK